MIKRLLLLVMLSALGYTANGQADSLGIEKKGEQVFVIHKVKSGQTLYALARRYATSVKKINDANPILQQGLKVGQTLKVPYGKPLVVSQVSKPGKTHTVAAGETLYAISRKYGITVDEIKRLNNLSSNALARGQKLVIEEAVEVAEPEVAEVVAPVVSAVDTVQNTGATLQEEVEQAEEPKVVAITTPLNIPKADSMASSVQIEKPEPVSYNGTSFKEIKEEGVAELIEEEEPSARFLALHKTAKVGTVIKIRNLKNDLAVYVRVVGNIPDTADNENILIKINKRAYDQIKAFDPRLRVELSYFQ